MLAHAMEAPKKWVPKRFMEERSKPNHVNPQEYFDGVTHPETGETITSYKKSDADPGAEARVGRGDVQRIRQDFKLMEQQRGPAKSQILNSRGDSGDLRRPHDHIRQNYG